MPNVVDIILALEDQAKFCERQMTCHYRDKVLYGLWASRRQDALRRSDQLKWLAVQNVERDTRDAVVAEAMGR